MSFWDRADYAEYFLDCDYDNYDSQSEYEFGSGSIYEGQITPVPSSEYKCKDTYENNEFGSHVAREYVKLFNFSGLRVDAALRRFLSRFCLVGESSDRERVLQYFAKHYHESNPGVFSNEDDVHTIACALLLLNTDLHGQNIGKRMSCRDFIENLSNAGFSFSRDLLKTLYNSIKQNPIEWAKDSVSGSEATLSVTTIGSGAGAGSGSTFLEYPDPESQVEYKKGWVMRKCLVDPDGKKTPFGRRGWKMFYATLKGLVLYLHKDEHGFKKGTFRHSETPFVSTTPSPSAPTGTPRDSTYSD